MIVSLFAIAMCFPADIASNVGTNQTYPVVAETTIFAFLIDTIPPILVKVKSLHWSASSSSGSPWKDTYCGANSEICAFRRLWLRFAANPDTLRWVGLFLITSRV